MPGVVLGTGLSNPRRQSSCCLLYVHFCIYSSMLATVGSELSTQHFGKYLVC